MARTLTIIVNDDGTMGTVEGGEFTTEEMLSALAVCEKAYKDRLIQERVDAGVKEALEKDDDE